MQTNEYNQNTGFSHVGRNLNRIQILFHASKRSTYYFLNTNHHRVYSQNIKVSGYKTSLQPTRWMTLSTEPLKMMPMVAEKHPDPPIIQHWKI